LWFAPEPARIEVGLTSEHSPKKESPMLVLSRKKNESIIINDDITIVVVEIRGDKVRLGVEAPKEVPVHRNEVYEAIRRNQDQVKAPASESDATSAAE
jgi:carbon storage regulator